MQLLHRDRQVSDWWAYIQDDAAGGEGVTPYMSWT